MELITRIPQANAGENYIGIVHNRNESHHLFMSVRRLHEVSWYAASTALVGGLPDNKELAAINSKLTSQRQYWSAESAHSNLFDGAWYYDFGTKELSYCPKDLKLSAMSVRRVHI